MSENNEQNKTEETKKNETTEQLKKEATNTVNQVKDTIKNTNIKEDSIETKNFIKEMLSKPASKLKEVVDDKKGKTFKYAIIILVVWVAAVLVGRICGGVFKLPFGTAIWSLIKAILSPLLGVIVLSVLVLLFNKDNKKSLTTIISTITIAKVPSVFASILVILNTIPGQIYKIVNPICSFCNVLTIILVYFAVKSLLKKNDDEAIKTFVIIEAIYFVIDFVLSFINMSI